jgi:hypothetical protein
VSAIRRHIARRVAANAPARFMPRDRLTFSDKRAIDVEYRDVCGRLSEGRIDQAVGALSAVIMEASAAHRPRRSRT